MEMDASLDNQIIQEHIRKKKYVEALEIIEKRLAKNPEDSDLYYFLGVMYYFKGELGKAIENLKKATERNPKNTDAAVCLSVLLNDIGKYDEAKQSFEQANQSVAYQASGKELSEIDRKFSVKHLEIADLYFRYRRYDEAVEEYSKAIMLDPRSSEIRIRRAKAYAKKGFLTRAIQELQEIIHDDPQSFTARIQLGLLHYSQGDLLEAELEWEAVIEHDPNNREAYTYLEMAKEARAKS